MSQERLRRALAYSADKLTILDLNRISDFLKNPATLFKSYVASTITEIFTTYLWGPGLGAVSTDIAGGILSGLQGVLNTALARNLNTLAEVIDPPGIYRFPLNPQSVEFGFAKLQSLQKYGYETFELQYFGNDIVTMRCGGQTMMLELPSVFLETISHLSYDLYKAVITYLPIHLLSPTWIKIHEFDTFYKQSSQELLLIWNWNVYYGYLTDFSYSWDIERAYRITYHFNFNLHPTKQWKLYKLTPEAFNSRQREINSNLAQVSLANLYM